MKYIFLFFFLTTAFNMQAQSKEIACSCCSEPYKAFDFWLGEWMVYKNDGTVAGTNTIDKLLDGCVIRENWKSTNGKYTGTSSNFYNVSTGLWEQIWIDNQGGSLHLKGNRIENQMILKSDDLNGKDGIPYYHKITWTKNPDGSVRQYWETIRNSKDTIVAFDGLYKKAN